jgi:hypothetical protein
MGAPSESAIATKICECQAKLLDRRFTMQQVRSYSRKYKEGALSKLIDDDTLLQRQMKDCSSDASGLPVFDIPAYRESFIKRCALNVQAGADGPVNDTLLTLFCNCAADILEARKISLDRVEELADENSFLYNEVAFKCGSPFLKPSDFARDWKEADSTDLKGPIAIDSVQVISIIGMHKVKITIGKSTKIWLLDSGASDMLISTEYLKELMQQGAILEKNFIGDGKYRLADNRVVVCKRYRVASVTIGRFVVRDVIISASKGVNEFLVGKILLNKFTQWTLDNKNNLLILKR